MSDSLDDAFGALGDEHRIRILRELGAADEPLSFSELRSRVDLRDSGQFNYHLNQLRDRYVEKAEDGYQLTRAGLRVNGAVVASAYAAGESLGPERAVNDCPVCGAEREVVYEDSALRVHCTEHDDHRGLSPLPPGATADRDLEELFHLGAKLNRHYTELVVDGTCPQCFGRTDVRVSDDGPLAEDRDGRYAFYADCESCGFPWGGPVGSVVTRHPAVVAAYRERGVNLRERTFLPHEFQPPAVESETPLRLRVDVPGSEGGDPLVGVAADETATVVDVTERAE
jgi:DNA-binding transcriptional ArsR family regulator